VRVEGRRVGDADRRLADARAKAVRSYLVKKGVADDRVGAIGKEEGGARPVELVLVP
jgi:outer membrane protein OmpA-like peptidoglycan-associated protein